MTFELIFVLGHWSGSSQAGHQALEVILHYNRRQGEKDRHLRSYGLAHARRR